MKILCIGDIVGKSGRSYLADNLKMIVRENEIDFIIANGENSAHGVGITVSIYEELLGYGIDIITLGNHAWAKKEIIDYIDETKKLIRPANYPQGTPGKGYVIYEKKGKKIAVINLCGRVYMECLECPFKTIDAILNDIGNRADMIIVDFHAEATSEKQAMGWYLDGKVTAVFGTHTHVQTSDERILPKGTGYITDVGMTGPMDSILGVERDIIINKFLNMMPARFEVASGPAVFGAIIFETDEKNNMKSVKRLNFIEKSLL